MGWYKWTNLTLKCVLASTGYYVSRTSDTGQNNCTNKGANASWQTWATPESDSCPFSCNPGFFDPKAYPAPVRQTACLA